MTPAQRFVCPRCRSAFTVRSRYCAECGADMQHASAIEQAARSDAALSRTEHGGSDPALARPEDDRRLGEANRLWLGKLVDGRYRVIDVVGRGGMGVVYKVEHVRMGKIAAMKVLHRDLAQDPDVIQRFQREAHAVSQLVHPNTVQVFDFGTAHDALYLIMEYVRGQDLQRILDRDGPMRWSRLAPLIVQMGGALQEAHDMGIVHRDLKPENVLVSRTTGGRDFAKVLDFGLAKLEKREARPEVTDRAQIVGTPYFMAPEQIRGDDVDARTDIYAMGALIYRALTGAPVFEARTAVGVLTKHLTAEAEAPSQRARDRGIAPQLDHLCMRALAKDPADRWQSVTELVAAVEEAYAELVSEASSGGRSIARAAGSSGVNGAPDADASAVELRRADLDEFERGIRRRRRWLLGGTAAAAAAAIGGVAWALTRPTPLRTREVEPNDELGQATAVRLGEVSGLLGRRRSKADGDRDMYRLDLGGDGGRQLVTLTLATPPNVDAVLTLRTPDGAVLAQANEGGFGGAERLRRRAVPRVIIVDVGQVAPAAGQLPIENVSDPYQLVVSLDAPDAAWEAEPNGSSADATPLASGAVVRGYLDGRDDVDVLRWGGPTGKVQVTVAAAKVPLVWSVADGVPRTGDGTVTLSTGATIKLERSDRDGPPGAPGLDEAWAVTVTPAP